VGLDPHFNLDSSISIFDTQCTLVSKMPGSGKAFVTLLTSPSYLPGVLVLLHSLLNLHPAPRDFQIVCLVTPETVDAKTIGELRNAGFDLVVGVEGIGSGKAGQDGLSLMGRSSFSRFWGGQMSSKVKNRVGESVIWVEKWETKQKRDIEPER
jgi:hypothetical protein